MAIKSIPLYKQWYQPSSLSTRAPSRTLPIKTDACFRRQYILGTICLYLIMRNLITRGVHILATFPPVMSCSNRVIVGSARDLACKLLERLPLGLGNQESSEDTAEHEKRVDLHNVIEPWGRISGRGGTTRTKRANENLGDDGANFSGCRGQTVRSGTIPCRKTLSRNNKCCSIRTLRSLISLWAVRNVDFGYSRS